jgi:hypothetical protein
MYVMAPKSPEEILEEEARVGEFWDRFKRGDKSMVTNKISSSYLRKIMAERFIDPKLIDIIIKQYSTFEESMKLIVANIMEYPRLRQEEMALYIMSKRPEYYRAGVFLFKKVAEINDGAAFGELALISAQTRNATI